MFDYHPPRRISLTARLVAGYTLACVITLIITGWVSNQVLLRQFERKTVDQLADNVATIRRAITSHPGTLHEAIELIVDLPNHRQMGIYFGRLLDENGVQIVATPGMDELVPDFSRFPMALPADKAPDSSSHTRLSTTCGDLVLLSAKMTQGPGNPELLYQVAYNVGHVDDWLSGYNRSLFLLIAVATAVSSVIGWIITRSGLAPLRDITDAVQSVTITGLGEHLGTKPWPAELLALAMEFDRMLERLDDSFQQLSEFSADAAHEFRTPLNNLMGASSLLLSRDRTPEEYRDALSANIEQYERLNRMIECLLFLARAEGKATGLNLQVLHPDQFARSAMDFFSALAEEKGVSLKILGNETVWADESFLRMALINILSNALRFTPNGGNITIRVESSSNGQTILTVADTGCGIAAEHLPKLFDRFYSVDKSRTSGGAGLGLALVRSIMKLHNGQVTVESWVGVGTTFRLAFPPPPAFFIG